MTRYEAQSFIKSLLSLRSSATDVQALSAISLYPSWKAGTDYDVGYRLVYDKVLYKVLQAHTSQEDWTPDITPSLYAKVIIPDADTIPEWEQPDSTNPYMTGNKVTHKGKTWVSDVDNNVWEPGVYGWTETEE